MSGSDLTQPGRPTRARVIAKVKGGLGNQMFIYAAARRLAMVNGADLVLDPAIGFVNDLYGRRYELGRFALAARLATARERLKPFGRWRHAWRRRRALGRPFGTDPYVVERDLAFDPRLLDLRFRGIVHLDGYWQSHRYFADVAPLIRQELRLPPPADDANRVCADRIRQAAASGGAIAVHVRFFDDPGANAQQANNASSDYYDAAIRQMQSRWPQAQFFVFSDKPAEAAAILERSAAPRVLVDVNQGHSTAGALADLGLMAACQHFVIANSTFSWWGAWLSQTIPDKCVIAPGFVRRTPVTAWGFDGLLPPDWIRL